MDARQVKEYAQIAQASYADFWPSDEKWRGGSDGGLAAKLQTDRGGFTESEAIIFAARYELLHQSIEDGFSNGFSAALFADKQSGRLVFSIRGTEPSDVTRDFFVTDLRIGVDGYASPQVIPLYRYFKQLTTPTGQAVNYSPAETARLRAVHFDQYSPLEAASADKGWHSLLAAMLADKGIDAGQGMGIALIGGASQVDVVGHSLGGHLAILMDRLFPSEVRQIVTLNAPGFDEAASPAYSEPLLARFSPGWNNSRILRIEANGDGVSKLGNFWPGVGYRTGQENVPGLVAPFSDNHSSVNGVDGLAVAEALGTLDKTIAADVRLARAIIDAASNAPERSYETVIGGLRKVVLGASAGEVATGVDLGTRDALYRAMTEIANSAATSALTVGSGASIAVDPPRARTDFASLVSLSLGTTLQLRTDNVRAMDALGKVHTLLYAAWTADIQSLLAHKSADELHITDAWLADRGTMLNAIVAKNLRDEPYGTLTYRDGLAVSSRYTDLGSGITVSSVDAQAAAFAKVVFGGEGADAGMVCGGRADRLYGAGGNDTLWCHAGAERLEGARWVH